MDKEHRDWANRTLKATFKNKYPELSKKNENELLPTIIWDYCEMYSQIKAIIDPPKGIASEKGVVEK